MAAIRIEAAQRISLFKQVNGILFELGSLGNLISLCFTTYPHYKFLFLSTLEMLPFGEQQG